MQRPNLILFGGSFDPPHLAHLILAQALADYFPEAEVRWMPSCASPNKATHHATPEQRLEMVHLAIEGNPRFSVSDEEVKREGPSFTFTTVERILSQQPQAVIGLAIGADQVASLASWHRVDELLQLVQVIEVRRPGTDQSLTTQVLAELLGPGGNAHQVEMSQLDISSSDIRRRIKAGGSIRFLVPGAVCDYIQQHGLYR